ncbi:ATP-binding protein [Desulfurispirillum indicum]|uniref:ATP-binding protein n=1 Tax=Desulfurispirillum indicum TaxID=936456 RepID=UPI001CFB7A8F|nr:ATP-binding protein [Desulfurispirillum indicum]UCZ55623.1 ATP-binding protein [Desulfurispirillum indicum]
MTISEIDWGNDSAEKDAHLLEYFVDSKAFQRVSEGRKSIVVGRKGSGKSALLKKLGEHFSEQSNTYLTVLTPKYNNIRTVLNDTALRKDFGEEIFFQHTWLRQICLDFLCCFGHRAKGVFCTGSLEFARKIAASQDCTSKDFVENISEILGRIKVKAGNLGEFGLAVENELRKVAELESLLHHIGELANSGAKFVVLIDDLDLGWDNSRIANNLLLGLLSAAGLLAGMNHSIKPILFLREDVYTILLEQTQHADKYRDVERIRWSQDQLVSILEARINFNRARDGDGPVDRAFSIVFPETIGTANTDNWLVERTLSRPRELIQFARYYTESLVGDEPSDKSSKKQSQNIPTGN